MITVRRSWMQRAETEINNTHVNINKKHCQLHNLVLILRYVVTNFSSCRVENQVWQLKHFSLEISWTDTEFAKQWRQKLFHWGHNQVPFTTHYVLLLHITTSSVAHWSSYSRVGWMPWPFKKAVTQQCQNSLAPSNHVSQSYETDGITHTGWLQIKPNKVAKRFKNAYTNK